MAAYCDTYDVQAELQRMTLTSTSKPTLAQVTDWCAEVGAEMEAVFAAVGVTLPITSQNALDVAERIAVLGVCAIVLRSVDMESERAAVLQDLYDKRLKMVREMPAMLEEPSSTDAGGVGSLVADENPTETPERKFHRELKEW